MDDPLEKYPVYIKAFEIYNKVLEDTEKIMKVIQGREIVKQLIRSSGSICSNVKLNN